MKKALVYWFSFLFILLWMTSCGGIRQTQKSETKSELKIEQTEKQEIKVVFKDTSNVKTLTEVLTNSESVTEKTTYTPIDPTKPSSYTDSKGNKKDLNNASHTEEKTTHKKNSNSKSDVNASSGTEAELSGKSSKKLEVDLDEDTINKGTSNTYSWFNLAWLWFLIPIAVIIIKKIFFKTKKDENE